MSGIYETVRQAILDKHQVNLGDLAAGAVLDAQLSWWSGAGRVGTGPDVLDLTRGKQSSEAVAAAITHVIVGYQSLGDDPMREVEVQGAFGERPHGLGALVFADL
jgi:hypothetical protein